jgi:galactose-1-phosphate uridylyltransferase
MRKHLAGPEIGAGNFIKDSAPEANAAALQGVSTVHYKQAAPHE